MAILPVSPNVISAELERVGNDNVKFKTIFYYDYDSFTPTGITIYTTSYSSPSALGRGWTGVTFTEIGNNLYQFESPSFDLANNPHINKDFCQCWIELTNNDFSTKTKESNTFMLYSGDDPTITNSNIYDGEIIDASWVILSNTYNQAQSDPLDFCVYTLFDENNNVLEVSDKIFNTLTPPLVIPYYFENLKNNTTYKVGVYMRSQHGLEVSKVMTFSIEYDEPIIYGNIVVKNKCNDGYMDINSNVFFGKGITNPDPMIYVDEGDKYSAYAVKSDPIIEYQRSTSSWIYWNEEIDINTDFVLKFWFSVASTEYPILRFLNDTNNYVDVRFKRNRDLGDYVEVSTSEGTFANSNFLPSNERTNDTNRYFVWVKVVDGVWEVILEQESSENTVLNWNDSDNNTEWNRRTDRNLYGENYETNPFHQNAYYSVPNNFNKILVGNAVCRQLEVTNDITLEYANELDTWDNYTVLLCDFNQNVGGGSAIEEFASLRIKRREGTSGTWITLYEQEVTDPESCHLTFRDYGVPKGIEQWYALVPVDYEGNEGNYVVTKITPNWNGTFVYDGEKCFKLYSSINYGSGAKNKPVGMLTPIGTTYPIVIENSDNNYMTGIVSGQILGYNYENTRILDRNDVTKETQDYLEFLINGKAKLIYDWNGNCWLTKVTDSPTVQYDMQTTNGINSVMFSWVEQGKYNNQADLEKFGFISPEIDDSLDDEIDWDFILNL